MFNIGKYLRNIFTGKGIVPQEILSELEEILIMSDLGPELTDGILTGLRKEKSMDINNLNSILSFISDYLLKLFDFEEQTGYDPFTKPVKLVMGVNGTGKTTTIAKLANFIKKSGKSSLLVAADTYRAAAIEQLEKWSLKLNVRLVKGIQGGDAGAVVFDSIESFKARGEDFLIIDSSGRMHTRTDLIEELKKILRVIEKNSEKEIEKILILDSTTGQNAYNQAGIFKESTGVDSIVLTKIDGDSKGGTIFRIVRDFKIPISFICDGERVEDIKQFKIENFLKFVVRNS